MTTPEPDRSQLGDAPMRAAVIAVFISGLVLTAGALCFFDTRVALGVLIGGVLATANLAVFARLGDAFLAKKGNTVPWAIVAMLKLVFLFGGIWLLLDRGLVPGIALAVGYASMPIGITFGSLLGPKPPDDDAAAG